MNKTLLLKMLQCVASGHREIKMESGRKIPPYGLSAGRCYAGCRGRPVITHISCCTYTRVGPSALLHQEEGVRDPAPTAINGGGKEFLQ